MKNLIRKIIWPIYLAMMVLLSGAGVASYINASEILKDHTVVQAPIELVDTSNRTKKGHTTTTYEFRYRYTVQGREYIRDYSAVNEKGERFLDAEFMEIAYDNADPSRSGALHVLERKSSLGRLVKRIMVGGTILGVIALFIFAWAAPRTKPEPAAAPAGIAG